MGQKVLVFGDIGIDDTVALIYGYFDNTIDIVGVVANYGNIPREKAMANVNYIREWFDIDPSIEVVLGAEKPMTGEIPEFFPEIHGEYGLGPIEPPLVNEGGVVENFFEVVEIIKRYHDQDLVIVNIGRLTSLATMFILYPFVMGNVQHIYMMGGAFWVPGNATAVSEANFYGDPIAARLVLKNAYPVTIVPLNVTMQAIATPQMVDYISRVGRTKIIKPLLDYYYHFYKQRNPGIYGSPLHDVVTLMATVDKDMFVFRYLPVDIIQSENGVDRGQSITDIRPYVDLQESEANDEKHHRIALELDYWQFYNKFMSIMTGQAFQ
ncbi:inosine-uridine preferring nucleoside hydrolase [Lentibacillus kapialis]|uniref:Inosine-uridine preferring nucleoside hydrolase n=1 Tax=Lentibacillus kapialis TaxID=340214 RepID=A0A917Q0C3_9BACI|nr:nucleoside hydrolase [Lentibacillus kapialis]GGK03522.1 inosine-uridine preferring nucleoside hydrolase [Lentibacillus kapialis]